MKKKPAPKRQAPALDRRRDQVAQDVDAAFRVLDLVAENPSLRRACQIAGISKTKFLSICAADPGIADQYARAREAGLDEMAEEILEIADDSSRDTKVDANGVERCDNEWVQRSRLKVEARKWLLSKLLPKKYGDKVDVTSAGEKLQAPQVMVIAGREVTFGFILLCLSPGVWHGLL